MKASKTLASLLAAAAVAGSIGLAYAQTTTPDSSAPSTTPAAPAMGNQGTTTTTPSTMPAATEPAGMQTERPAQADRN